RKRGLDEEIARLPARVQRRAVKRDLVADAVLIFQVQLRVSDEQVTHDVRAKNGDHRVAKLVVVTLKCWIPKDVAVRHLFTPARTPSPLVESPRRRAPMT